MLLIGITGLLLGWKKQTDLLPPTQRSIVEDKSVPWISLDSLQYLAVQYAQLSLGKSSEIDRIDIRPQKGIAKIRFAHHFTEIQIDGKSGAILSVSQRNSDLVEMIHDGSIVDYLLGLEYDSFKLLYTTLSGAGLVLLSFSGFWLWLNPKRIRKAKAKLK